MRALRELWSSRSRKWITIPATLGACVILWYMIDHRIAPAAAWQQCEEAYHRARSAKDSARVDELRPFVRREVPSLSCGLLRAERSVASPSQHMVGWLSYEPAKVQLEGVLDTLWRYGPPNFGETPEQDGRVLVAVLRVTSPIDIRGDSTSDLNSEGETGVTVMQLVGDADRPWPDSVGAPVMAYGSLFHGHTGHHYTTVLMTVDSVRWRHPD